MPGEGFVDRVVDDLVDEVVQAARAGGADVHAGPLADRLEAFEDLDVLCVIGAISSRDLAVRRGPGRGARAGRSCLRSIPDDDLGSEPGETKSPQTAVFREP